MPDKVVVGYARISQLPRNPEGCYIESGLIKQKEFSQSCSKIFKLKSIFSVVICRSARGKGLGRIIMNGCNDVASKLGFSYLYLSTHDQQGFYTKLGYELCEPVCHFGCGTLPIPQSSVRNILEFFSVKYSETNQLTIAISIDF